MQLETEHLILRPWQESDLEWVYEYFSDPAVAIPSGLPTHTSMEDSRRMLTDVLSAPNTFALYLKSEGHVIGDIVLMIGQASFEKLPDTEAELGYWIGKPYWGQGLTTEAARKMIRYAFEELKLEKLWSGYFDGNDASRRVQEKCGFRYCYTKREFYWEDLKAIRTEHFSCLTREEYLSGMSSPT